MSGWGQSVASRRDLGRGRQRLRRGGRPGATRPVPIASVAKLMTVYVILHDHPLPAGGPGPDIIEPSEAAAYPVLCQNPAQGLTCWLYDRRSC